MVAQKHLHIDVNAPIHQSVMVVQGESDGRTLYVALNSGGIACDLTGCAVTLYARLPSDEMVFDAFTIDDAAAGQVSILLSQAFCAVAGKAVCEVRITGTGGEVTKTQPFIVTVVAADDYTAAVEATSEYTALDTALGLVSGHEARILAVEAHVTAEDAVAGIVKGDGAGAYSAAGEADIPRAGGATFPFTAMPFVGVAPIVERDSNVNGDYVKYADGTMICRHALSMGSIKDSGAGTWAAPYCTADQDWTFPVAFIAAPQVVVNGYINSGVAPRKRVSAFYQNVNATTTVAVCVMRIGDDSSDVNANTHIIAIGRWK